MDSIELFDKVSSNYSRYADYEESGSLQFGDTSKSFSISYARPRSFKITWDDMTLYKNTSKSKEIQREPRYGQSQIWTSRNHVFKKLFYDDQIEEFKDLKTALLPHLTDGFRLILATSALLQPTEFGSAKTLLSMEPIGQASEAHHEERICLVVLGSLLSPKDTEVWLDKESLRIVRCRQKIWFKETRERMIADRIPDNDNMPHNYDCHYRSTLSNAR